MTTSARRAHRQLIQVLTDDGSVDPDRLTDISTLSQRAELNLQMTRLTTHLDSLEQCALAALPDPERVFCWAPFSMDTGLSEAQEDFVGRWSPRDVLNQCVGQREMVRLLRTWLTTNQDPESLDVALAMVCAFSNALPE